MTLQPFVGAYPLFQFLIFYAVGGTPWTGDQPVARPLPVHRTTQTQNKRTHHSVFSLNCFENKGSRNRQHMTEILTK
jgi:hypothetical protein